MISLEKRCPLVNKSVNEKVIQLQKRQKECIVSFNDAGEPVAYYELKKKRALGVNWVAMFQAGMEYLSQQKNMSGEQWRVFAYLMSRLDYDNYLRVPQKEIAEHLDLTVPNVSRAIKALIELDVIIPGPLAGRFKTYRLNPRIGLRGTKHKKETIIEYDELRAAHKKKQKSNDK